MNLQDSAFIVVGSNDSLSSAGDKYSGFISKFDYEGNMVKADQYITTDTIFYQTYNSNSDDQFKSIVRTPDNNLMTVGLTQSYGATNLYDIDILLMKLNYNLDTLWTKVLSHPNDTSLRPNKIINTTDGGFLICGWQNSYTSSNVRAFLCKVDSLGNLQWRKSYSNLIYTSTIWSVVETSDHGFICVGGVYDITQEGNPFYMKVDSSGYVEWTQIQVTLYSDWFRNIIGTLDGNYLISGLGTVGNPTYRQNRFQKITESGVVIWDKSFGLFSSGSPLGILQNSDSTFMMTGANGVNGGSQGILMKLSAVGDSLWTKNFGEMQDDGWFWDISLCADGGYIMCGETYCCNFTPGVGNTSSLWLVRTDSLGLLTGLNEFLDSLPGTLMSNPFPNPANNYFEVNITIPETQIPYIGNSEVELLLFDIEGKQLALKQITTNTKSIHFDISDLAAGTYYVVLSLNGYNAGGKVIVKN